ncbi:MAG: AAA family ATPase [Candidatus Omnitrophica bacterium]|nr:AAA family ATPase [Candidatus Omnitrophota bacterium]MBU1923004.1 AAA family ATPase [Candidatus Omnitrophota bacterium]
MRKIFIAATNQNDGKTTVSLGIIKNLQDKFSKVGFIKPIGQRYLEEEGLKIDEDSILIEEVCGIKSRLKDMSPIAVEKGFTEKYIMKPDKKDISSQIRDSFRRISKNQELVVIEGTGHAGVGSVFDHSNATVARLLGSKVIIISSGGVGRPIDEIILNKALFEKNGVKVLGVIVNKVLPNKFDKINRLVRKGLERKGVDVLGVLPFNPILARPTFGQILEETDFQVICGKEYVERSVAKVIVAAMEARDAVRYISDDSLMITPGDREDMIICALSSFRDTSNSKLKICGMILTSGITPEPPIMNLLSKAQIPVLLAKSDTYDVATCVHDLTVKIRPCDKDKIDTVIKLIKENVDFKKILKGI